MNNELYAEVPSTLGWVGGACQGLAGVARYADGKRALQRSGRFVPEHLRFYLAAQWGHFYREMRDEKRAERWYRKAVALKSSTATHVYLGASLARQGRFAEAKRHHRLAIQLATDPKYDAPDEAYFNLSLILRAERKYSAAATMLRKAIGLDRRYQVAKEALRDVELAARLRKMNGRVNE